MTAGKSSYPQNKPEVALVTFLFEFFYLFLSKLRIDGSANCRLIKAIIFQFPQYFPLSNDVTSKLKKQVLAGVGKKWKHIMAGQTKSEQHANTHGEK